MTKAKEMERPTYPTKLGPSDLQDQVTARAAYRIEIKDQNIKPEDVLRPEFWTNVAAKFNRLGQHRFPIVEIVWGDGSRYMEVMITDAGKGFAIARVLRLVEFDEPAVMTVDVEQEEFKLVEIKIKGKKFQVVRKSDREVMADDLVTKQAAKIKAAELEEKLSKPA